MGPELLRRDVHPAEILLPGGRLLLEARAFVTDRRLLVWKRTNEGVRQVLELPIVDAPTASRSSLNGGALELRCLVEEGEEIVYLNQGHGCGCGSPLKALVPGKGTLPGWTT